MSPVCYRTMYPLPYVVRFNRSGLHCGVEPLAVSLLCGFGVKDMTR